MKLIKTALVILLALSISACGNKNRLKDDIHIVFTSDVHCGVDENIGYAGLRQYVDELKIDHDHVTLVDLGDFAQGGTLGSLSKGEIIVDIMNDVGYDIATFGNHEFDYGMDGLKNIIDRAEFEMIACNVAYSGNSDNVFADIPEYVIKDYDGVKVGYVGIITPQSLKTSTPKYFMEDGEYVYGFYGSNDGHELAKKVQDTVDRVRSEGANYVVAMSHLGYGDAFVPFDSVSLIRNTSGIDAVLDGHSHSEISGERYQNKNGQDVVLVSCGTKLANIGELIICKDGSIESLLVSQYDSVSSMVSAAYERLDEILSVQVGKADFNLVIGKDGIRQVRDRETNLGDFVADAYRAVMGTDIAITNGGGIRTDIKSGDISVGNLIDVHPFQNDIASCYASGQQILDMLEFTSRYVQKINVLDGKAIDEFGGFLQVSGMKYTIDTSIDSSVVVDENGAFVSVGDRRRVKDVYVLENGVCVPIDKNKMYSLAGISYVLFGGGDGNTVLSECEKIVESGPTDANALKAYIEMLGGTIPEEYREVQGRITVE